MIASLIILWLLSPLPELTDPKESWQGVRVYWQRATGPQPPRMDEIRCWPCNDTCKKNYCFAWSYSCWLDNQQGMSLDRDYRPLINEAERCRMIWYHLDDATQNWPSLWSRRQSAAKAKALMGDADWFYRTAPVVPLWRFRDVTP